MRADSAVDVPMCRLRGRFAVALSCKVDVQYQSRGQMTHKTHVQYVSFVRVTHIAHRRAKGARIGGHTSLYESRMSHHPAHRK